jgi:hypothetical protein
MSLLSTSYKILSNILLSRLSSYVDEIIGDHKYRGFAFAIYWRRNGALMRQYTSYS